MASLRKSLGRTLLLLFAAAGLAVSASALTLWLSARPVLAAAASDYAQAPVCSATGRRTPPGYPVGVREVQSLENSEYQVYRETCDRHAISGCYYLRGAPRSLGFTLYRPAYLSECQLRALTLRTDSLLGITLHRLHPHQDPATLDSAQLDCVAAVLRTGWSEHAAKLGRCTLPRPPTRPGTPS